MPWHVAERDLHLVRRVVDPRSGPRGAAAVDMDRRRRQCEEVAAHDVVATAADEHRLLHAQEEVALDRGGARHIVEIDALDLEAGRRRDVVDEVVPHDRALRRDVASGVDRAGVRGLGRDVGDLVQNDLVVVALEADRGMGRIGDEIAGDAGPDALDLDRELVGPSEPREAPDDRVLGEQARRSERLAVAAGERDSALAGVADDRAAHARAQRALEDDPAPADPSHRAAFDDDVRPAAHPDGVAARAFEGQVLDTDVARAVDLEEVPRHRGLVVARAARNDVDDFGLSVPPPLARLIELGRRVRNVEARAVAQPVERVRRKGEAAGSGPGRHWQGLERPILAEIARDPEIGLAAPALGAPRLDGDAGPRLGAAAALDLRPAFDFAAALLRLSRPGCPLPQILLNGGGDEIEFVPFGITQFRTHHSLPATRIHEHWNPHSGSEASELAIEPDLSSHHRFATALHSPNDVTRGVSGGAWRRVKTMEGDEGFYGGAKIRGQRLDRLEGSLDSICQQQLAYPGLIRAKLVAEPFGSRSSSETRDFRSGQFEAPDTNATP